jgi:NADH-quinone oxidoreductase subunit M
MLFGAARAPHLPLTDINAREKTILAILVAAVFWLGLFPQDAMRKTELAARQYQAQVAGEPAPQRTAERAPAEGPRSSPVVATGSAR